MSCPPLESMGRFAVVVVDPPWNSGGFLSRIADGTGQGPDTHDEHDYDVMTLSEIAALPIPAILADDAWLFLWATQSTLPDAISLLPAWDVQYAMTMIWHKHFGAKPSQRPTYNAEFIVVGKKGKPKFLTTRGFDVCYAWPHERRKDCHPNGWGHAVYENSAKPEGFYDLLRRTTQGPRIDLFNRRIIAGFQGWGHESPMDDGGHDHYQKVLL